MSYQLKVAMLFLAALLLPIGWWLNYNMMPGWLPHMAAAILLGVPTLIATIHSLFQGKLDVDLLMLLGALGAIFVGHVDEAAILLFLFVLSGVLEEYAMGRTRTALKSLMQLRPDNARVQCGDSTRLIPLTDVSIGTTIVVYPGERVPLDGVIVSGEADMDESALTGEAVPVWKESGDTVMAGSINLSGALYLDTTRSAGQSTLARIVELIESAQRSRAVTQRMLDQYVWFYVILVLSTSCFIGILLPLIHIGTWSEMSYLAITVLVVASPCALVISTPATILSAIAAGARKGILFKGGASVEQLALIDTIAFDKTGTLTTGKLVVSAVIPLKSQSELDILAIAAAAEQASEHPLAKAIVTEARKRGVTIAEIQNFKTTAGLGVEALVDGKIVIVGSSRFLKEKKVQIEDSTNYENHSEKAIWVSINHDCIGRILLQDQIRPEAIHATKRLQALGIKRMVMITGDDSKVATKVANDLNITDMFGELLPEEKVDKIRQIESEGSRCAMVGDGINDAPALSAATIGIAMGAAGTDLAIESADVVLMSSRLDQLTYALELSQRARHLLNENLFFSSLVIVVLLIVAVTGWLPLSIGVLGHEGSTLVVVLNGLRLLGFSPRGIDDQSQAIPVS